jgi:ligand-binding sensor domain-containing protein
MKFRYILSVFLFFSVQALAQPTGDTVKAIFIDQHDVKWLGTNLGLLRFDGTNWTAYNTKYNTPGEVTSIALQNSDSKTEIWVGTKSGIFTAEYNIDGITAATRFHKGNTALGSDTINDITLDSSNTRYFATPLGLGIFEVDQWTWLEQGWGSSDAGIPNRKLLSLGAKNDTVYVGSAGRGAGRIINEIDGFSGASYYEQPFSEIAGSKVTSIYTDKSGYQWFGTTDGLSLHTTQKAKLGWDLYITTHHGLANDTINAILEDSAGTIWLATNGGISKYNPETEEFTNYTISMGLADNAVYDIAQDSDSKLWFATAKGISSFDGENFINYPTAEHAKNFVNILESSSGPENAFQNEFLEIYPNPSSSEVYVHFTKNTSMNLNVSVYNISGKKIHDLFKGFAGGGDLKVKWDLTSFSGSKVPQGIYFVIVESESMKYTSKLVVF